MISFKDAGLTRHMLNNVGNTNGRDVSCLKCEEPWENAHISDEFSDYEYEEFVMLDSQYDDPGGSETRIAALNGCPCCE